MIHNTLKRKLKEGKATIGTFLVTGAPDLVEICGLAGYDFVVIDGEHGPTGPENATNMIRAAEVRGTTPIIRIPNRFESSVLHFLDIGAHGIQVPQINNAEAAKEIVARAKYEPVGMRGVAFPRAADYGLCDISKYFSHENEETLIITHCENKIGLENLEEICQVPEIDVIFLGPYDMSQSMGVTGQVTHPLVEDAAKRVIEITRKYNKAAGIFAGTGEIAKQRADQGFQYITIGMDVTLFGAKCVQEAKAFRA
ncbi:MAG: aldolase/citrate lyase family protein [Eubacteriales bacterium]|nr:aldolase/citrate lyase family protein [Eubacteriales bacterium]